MVNRQRNVVADLFNEVQGSRPSRKNVVLLRQHLIDTDLEQFSTSFFSCLNRALVCKKSDANSDRVLKFVAVFVSLLESPDGKDADLFADLTSALIEHLLRGIESKEKNVRYRICQLLAFVMTSGLSEIDEELFESLQTALTKRLRDKESSVRAQAVIALSRFQAPVNEDDDNNNEDEQSEDESAVKVTEILLHVLSHDPSQEVRRTVLHNLSQSSSTLPFLLERARDLDPVLRRQIYSTILPSINGFKPLSISKRNKLLKWGLKDRDESVRRAAEKMFAIDWLNLANGSILELLQRLDIVNSTIGEDVMRAFFNVRPEFISQITFDDEFWNDLNPESIFLVRCMSDFAQKREIAQAVADKLPELSSICDLIVKYIVAATKQEEAEKADTEFMIDNLLRLAMNADFSDEIGRKRLSSNCHEIMRSSLSEGLLVLCVEVLSKVAFSEQELTKMVRDIITDLYDTLQDEEEAEESFHSADSSLTARARSVTPKPKQDEDDAEQIQVRYIFTTLRVLAMVRSLLLHTKSTLKENAGLVDILQNIIVPAYRSHEGPICEKGIECLGQICLQDKDLAQQYLGHFFNCFAKGYEDLKILALKCVTDVLMAHPSLLVDATAAADESAEAAKELGGQASCSLEDDLVRIYLKAFQLEDAPEVTAMATQSVSKLLLFNILPPESPNARGLLKEMTVLYYSLDTADNQSLRQNLAYFFPVYAFSSAEHQAAMTSIVVSTIKRISRLYEQLDADERLDAVALLSIGNQLIDWTNPQKLVSSEPTPTPAAYPSSSSSSSQQHSRHLQAGRSGQVELVGQIHGRLRGHCDKDELRTLTAALSKLHISPECEDIPDLIEEADDMIAHCADPIGKRMIVKFKGNLDKVLGGRQATAVKPESRHGGDEEDQEDAETVRGDETTVMGDVTQASIATET